MEREIVYEVLTVFGWTRVDRETYWRYLGKRRWHWKDEEKD